MTKRELRHIYRQKRTAIDPREKLKLDDLLLIQLQQFYFPDVRVLFTYWPMAGSSEPNTHLFNAYLRHSIPMLNIAFPRANFDSRDMQAILIKEDSVYKTSDYGITEPSAGEVVDPAAIDLVFVPLLICDKEGNRVGYGKGFYDKFLMHCREDVIKIGFSYFEPVEKIDDSNAFDVPLNYCVTPQHLYEF
ncbi:MAG TPA: 5-formyltetrahydrofolate cyclo-ligase [Panacibacter sp.]|nr:5-formyltetrahydrofolate cyclo-ligase [Panacibacter sp.]HNP45217.1 5-formyltetrahydrofolate cyclo-ligase [Panacibacter sp.]